MSTAIKTGRQLADFAISLLGGVYMYGNNGWTISKWLIETTAKTYPRQYRDMQSDIDKYGMTKKQYLMSKIGERGYDCSTPADLFLHRDLSADGWLAAAVESGPIDTIPELPGLSVHYPGHTGVYIGNGYVVEARGTFYGIVKTELKARPWRHWAKLPGIVYDDMGEQEPMLKQGDKGELVGHWQAALLAAGFTMMHNGTAYGVDNSYGPATKNGTMAYQAARKLPVTGVVDVVTFATMAADLLLIIKNASESGRAASEKLALINDIING